MPTRQFPLEAGGPKRLKLEFGISMSSFEVSLDGAKVGGLEGPKVKSAAGQDLTLPDGSLLNVRLQRGLGAQLLITRNGQPVPESDGHPMARIKQSANLLYFIAGLNGLIGFLALVTRSSFLEQIVGNGWVSIVEGVIFGVLGFFTGRRSRLALMVALGLYALDSVLTLAAAAGATGTPNIGGLVVRVFFFIYLWRGLGAMKQAQAAA